MHEPRRTIKHNLCALWCSIILSFFVTGCSDTSDEDQIKENIQTLQIAVESESPNDFIDILDKGFLGNQQFNRILIKKYLIINFMRHSDIKIRITHTNIIINKSDTSLATANIKAILTGGKGLLPEQGRLMNIQSHWVKKNKKWVVKIAHWTR